MSAAGKYTPGPWRVAAPPDKVCTDYRDEGGSMLDSNWGHGGHAKTIVTCEHRSWMALGEEFANAHLIAAAPDLLEALRGAIEWMSCVEPHLRDGTPFKRNIESYKAAIAKAEGGEA